MDSTARQNQGAGAPTQTPYPPAASPDRMLQFFAYAHLPPALQDVSRTFHDVAHQIAATIPPNPERTAGLRKLLEAKDCIVRAVLYQP